MKIKWFMSKKELLEYLGKNPNDRKLVDRMVTRWEVKVEWSTYGLIMEKESCGEWLSEEERQGYLNQIDELKAELWKSMKREEELEQRLWHAEGMIEQMSWWEVNNDDIAQKYEELKINYEELCKENWRYKKKYELVINLTYRYAVRNNQIQRSDYIEQLREEVESQIEAEYWRED